MKITTNAKKKSTRNSFTIWEMAGQTNRLSTALTLFLRRISVPADSVSCFELCAWASHRFVVHFFVAKCVCWASMFRRIQRTWMHPNPHGAGSTTHNIPHIGCITQSRSQCYNVTMRTSATKMVLSLSLSRFLTLNKTKKGSAPQSR